ncbi:helix-turn-helix transcriptional regulator [Streptomyces sp. NBC_00879]|uniref:helix-turn-helix domain-containing protein n=1 Tax=Streptomyces sp. NBC_00879 TaxID=2975855 RepID=UPI00386FE1BE|nr:helix-turn-helix transcriptional regulator [Streptomyces sp. NBC_00879]
MTAKELGTSSRGRRGLAPLGPGLEPEAAAFATYLREMTALSGATLAEVAEATGKDTSTVSRYCSGERLPELAWLRDFLSGVDQRARLGDGADRQGRELLWAAARVKGPLVDRQFQLDRAAEELAAQREQAAAALALLREDLEAERERRRLLEEQLHSERHAAQARIEELEDQIRQSEAVLRLLQHDEERMVDMIRETAEELTSWTSGGASVDEHDEFAQLAVAPADQVVSHIKELGQEGKAARVQDLLKEAAKLRMSRECLLLLHELREASRFDEDSHYRGLIGHYRPAEDTATLVAAWQDRSNSDLVERISPFNLSGDMALILTAARKRPWQDLQQLFQALVQNQQSKAVSIVLGNPADVALAPGTEGTKVLVAAWLAGCRSQVDSILYRASHSQLEYIELDIQSVQARNEFPQGALDELHERAKGARRLTLKGRFKGWVRRGFE